jgi:carbonic anhydrase
MSGPTTTCTPAEALQRLRAGNARFVRGEAVFPTVQARVLTELKKGQQPFATILSCSDSRVPPELVFDAGLGDLFVIRVAGNVLGPSVSGTLEYAAAHLHTPLFVVMGHENCGAVTAAIDTRVRAAQLEKRISVLLENILPALDDIDLDAPAEARLHAAVEANVRRTMRTLQESPEGRAASSSGEVMLVGAIYDLDSGRVTFLEGD